ncbi:hypothetical protein WDU94_013257 [Cyamophila willieti]
MIPFPETRTVAEYQVSTYSVWQAPDCTCLSVKLVPEATPEVTVVLGALGALLVALVLVFVYLSSKWCTEPSLDHLGNLPCEDPFSIQTGELEKNFLFDGVLRGGTNGEDAARRNSLAQFPQHIVSTNQPPLKGTYPPSLPQLQQNIHVNVHTIIKEKPTRSFKDLLSLAEAGRIGRSSGSSSGSTTSADDEQHALRYRDKLKVTQPNCVSEEPPSQTLQDVSEIH